LGRIISIKLVFGCELLLISGRNRFCRHRCAAEQPAHRPTGQITTSRSETILEALPNARCALSRHGRVPFSKRVNQDSRLFFCDHLCAGAAFPRPLASVHKKQSARRNSPTGAHFSTLAEFDGITMWAGMAAKFRRRRADGTTMIALTNAVATPRRRRGIIEGKDGNLVAPRRLLNAPPF